MQKLDIEHLLFWFDAIRNSPDPKKTLDSFWKGQIRSKVWLIKQLRSHIQSGVSIDIHGGWNGVLASMIFQSSILTKHIRSIDIDPSCEEIARTVNKLEETVGKFSAITADMCDVDITADVVINTSCEHITQTQYNEWLSHIPRDSLILLQSNDYEIEEHVRIAKTLDEFKKQSQLDIIWAGELELPLYNRWMIIGKKISY